MAHYSGTVQSPRSATEVFEDLADFRSVARWDPGVATSEHTRGTIGEVGAHFLVTMNSPGPDIRIDYEITEIDHPQRVVLYGTNAVLESIDVITVAKRGTGCEVTYDATIRLKGPLRPLGPLMAVQIQLLGANGKRGLISYLNP